MSENRLADYLEHIRQAATDARSFVEGINKSEFLVDTHGYFDINLDVVWDTVQTALPKLLEQLHNID